MADNKLFKIAGISTFNGVSKVRFTNDLIRRVKKFTKRGETRIDFVDLPRPMYKMEALQYLSTHADFQSAHDQGLIADSIAMRERDAKKGEVKVKANKQSLGTTDSHQAKTAVTQ